jgi:hypothetical protein
MFATNTYRIRLATDEDRDTLDRLAERKAEKPLAGRVLIGETRSGDLAALSLDNGRVLADSSPGTDHLVASLRVRAVSIWANDATPSLRERMLAGLPAWYQAAALPVSPAASDTADTEHEPVLVHA